jgi:hypothetical protein
LFRTSSWEKLLSSLGKYYAGRTSDKLLFIDFMTGKAIKYSFVGGKGLTEIFNYFIRRLEEEF